MEPSETAGGGGGDLPGADPIVKELLPSGTCSREEVDGEEEESGGTRSERGAGEVVVVRFGLTAVLATTRGAVDADTEGVAEVERRLACQGFSS